MAATTFAAKAQRHGTLASTMSRHRLTVAAAAQVIAAALQVFPLTARANEASSLPTFDSELSEPGPPNGAADLTDLPDAPKNLPPDEALAPDPLPVPAQQPAEPEAAIPAAPAAAHAPHPAPQPVDTSATDLDDNITVSDSPLPDDLGGDDGASPARRPPRAAARTGRAGTRHPLSSNDRDEDGVPDSEDACPEVAGTVKSGCPKQLLARRGAQKIITAPLNFAWGTQIIRENDNSYEIIAQVASIMLSNPQMHITLVGYTDGLGPRRANLQLARRRAAVVREALIQHGVELWRLSVAARGPINFVRTNKTPHGRARNRRVEFFIGKPSGRARPPSAN
jgi:outer membrane protein OmpA-like peptidoglycan-associated protein